MRWDPDIMRWVEHARRAPPLAGFACDPTGRTKTRPGGSGTSKLPEIAGLPDSVGARAAPGERTDRTGLFRRLNLVGQVRFGQVSRFSSLRRSQGRRRGRIVNVLTVRAHNRLYP